MDLAVTPAERAEIEYQIRWFSRFTVSEKLAFAARHRRLAARLRAMRGDDARR